MNIPYFVRNDTHCRFAAGGGPRMDAVYDRGALVAVEPSLRERYAAVVAQRMARSSITLVPIRPRRR
eukprot:10436-Pelagococcus_subviridis.AAC.2